MILPRNRIPKPFVLYRIEGVIAANTAPTMPKFRFFKTDKQKSEIGIKAAWRKRAKRLANSL